MFLDSTMTSGWERVPVLLHEMLHALRFDNGPQAPTVEAQLDRCVALLLIDPQEWQEAVDQVGTDVLALSKRLDLACWVV
ncbi:hypothetical protein, partial [Tsukamurella conjunctivitidis]|uniref:hypothetical protein n=1 Tax=Tsukamurella conjunctivitidis TaxID=2592068 RepID=UPI001960698D